MVASTYVDFVVTGDPGSARVTVEQALAGRRFRMTWHDDWTGIAERGSKVAYMLVGALAQYFKVGVRLMAAGPDEITVRIERQSSGLMGGAIGATRTTKNMTSLRSELEATFGAAGVLRSVNEV